MTDYLIVLPIIDTALAHQCMRSMDRVDHGRVIVVDNRAQPNDKDLPWTPGRYVSWQGLNVGVPTSWNYGASRVVREMRDLLVICSQAICFNDGGRSLLDAMDGSDEWGMEVIGAGWHLIGLTRKTLEAVGPFDEGFYPAYYEDTDYLYRMGLLGLPSPRENGRSFPFVTVDYGDAGPALAIAGGLVHPSFATLTARYIAKWGGDQGKETFRTPFDSGKPTWWWPDTQYAEEDPWWPT